MSHFTVLVITNEKPTDEVLTKTLQKWHEYECTGVKDEYVVFEDETDDVMQEWTTKQQKGYRGPDGKVYKGHEHVFYRAPTDEEHAKIGKLPGSIGFNGDISYRTRHDEDVPLIRDETRVGLTLFGGGTGDNIPRGWRLASEAETAEIKEARKVAVVVLDEDGDEIEVTEGTTPSGLRWKTHKVRLAEPKVEVHYIPEGFTEESFPLSQFYRDVDHYAKDYHGYERSEDGTKLGHWTNPNRKWDWWVVGGRWRGMLMVRAASKAGSAFDDLMSEAGTIKATRHDGVSIAKVERVIEMAQMERQNGRLTDIEVRGILRHMRRHGASPVEMEAAETKLLAIVPKAKPKSVEADSCQMRDLDLEGMQDRAAEKAGKTWDEFNAAVAGRPYPDFEALRNEHGIEKARELYHADPVVQDVRKADFFFLSDDDVKALLKSREDYVERARRRAFSTFAVVKDGKWYERGEMGWWAVVHDEKEADKWEIEFHSLVTGLDPDTYITVIDAHI